MIKIKGITHKFDDHIILNNININLNNKKIGIIGDNGSGKSTFAKLLNGLLIPTEGAVFVDDLETSKNGKEIRRKVGFIFQNPDNQIVFPTVEEDLAFGLKNIGLNKKEIENKIDKMLSFYNIEDLKYRRIHELSGGEKQLISIVGVLIMEPKYIIFDEPTSSLDLKNKQKISNIIDNLDQHCIVISHDLDLFSKFDQVIIFDKGNIIKNDKANCSIGFYKRMIEEKEFSF
ncbi:MAG: ABC transporter ATP-binding protein [Bacteroidetes bacterium]|nr:ABC transporter ATP-binding protein [Bacteroidota bacterium]